MKSEILVLALLFAPMSALADDIDPDLQAVIERERADAARVRYHAREVLAAERAIVNSRVARDIYRRHAMEAERLGHRDAARYWSLKRDATLRASATAHEELVFHRNEREHARREHQAAAAELRSKQRGS